MKTLPKIIRFLLAALFTVTAIAHFNSIRHDLAPMVPPWVPYPDQVVVFTGVCELLGAIGLLIPATRKLAAIMLIIFLVAVFPSNMYAAHANIYFRSHPPIPLVPRFIMQIVLIGIIWWAGIFKARE